MDIYEKVMLASAFWGVVLAVCNPFLENKRMKYAAAGCFVVCTLAFLVQP